MIEEIRRFQKHQPFRPFEIILIDGRKFRVPHPDFILVPPKGAWVYLTDKHGNTEHLNIVVISSVRHTDQRVKRRKVG